MMEVILTISKQLFMRKRWLLVVFAVLGGTVAKSQNSTINPVTAQSEIDAFKSALTNETAIVNDIKADFVQTKTVDFLDEAVISSGTLYFATGKRLRWEYQKPYSFVFILNGAKAWMVNQGATTELDVNTNKMLKELSELMLFGMGGTALFENPNFDFSFGRSQKQWRVCLKPKSKEMKTLYTQIEVFFALPTHQMESVRMVEVSGDETLIHLTNQKINTLLPDTLFDGKR